jgi:DNA-binding response OmpR family regulator
VSTALRKSRYAVDVTGDGAEGLWYAESNSYDVIILDLMLPVMDGLTILDRLRKQGRPAPVLILTARDTVDDRVRGLQAGADDYLIKPFALEELLARVHALCRRRYRQPAPRLTIGDLEINTAARTAKRGRQTLELSPREYRLLEYLACRAGEVVSRTEIWEHIYDEQTEPMSNAVDSAICTLRKKLDLPGLKPLLWTRRGMGYALQEKTS